MAQYDGSIRINTEIATQNAKIQLSTLENSIVKTADKVAILRSKMDALKNQKIPTEEYQALDNYIKQLENSVKNLTESLRRLEREGLQDCDVYRGISSDIEKMNTELELSKSEMQTLVDAGKAFTLGSSTDEFAKLGQQLKYAENDLEVLNQRHELLLLKQRKNTDAYKILGNIAKKSFNSIGNVLKKANSLINSFGKRIKEAFSKFLKSASGATRSANGFGFSLKNILKYSFGIQSLNSVVNKLRSGMKEGFTNLYNDKNMSDFKNQVDSLKASVLTFKNAFAAAFRPIVDIVIPYIQRLTDYMINLMDVIGQFMAAITGQKSYTRAIKQTTAAIEDQNKARNKQLSGLDKLNNLSSGSGDTNDSGAAGTMFEEVPLGDNFKNISQWLKDMWESADFTDLGAVIGIKLKSALDSIPWENIKKSARKIGSSIATLINGGVEVPGIGYSIGDTLAQAINTGFENLNAFVHGLRWDSVGTFIADSLNGLFGNVDWDLIKDTFVTGVKGLASGINSFISDFNWDNVSDTLSGAVNTISESIHEFLFTVNWEELGYEIGDQLTETMKKIDWEKVGNAIGDVIQLALDFVTGLADGFKFEEAAQAIIDALGGFFDTVNMEQLAQTILALLAAKIALTATASLFKEAGIAILKALGKAISSATGTMSGIASGILSGIGTAFTSLGGLGGILTTDLATIFGAGTAAEIGVTIGTGILGGIAAAFAGGVIGKLLDNYILGPIISLFDEDLGNYYKNFKWFGEGGFFDFFSNVSIEEALRGLSEWAKDSNSQLGILLKTKDKLEESGFELSGWAEYSSGILGSLDKITQWDGFSEWWDDKVAPWFTKEKWEELFQNIKDSAAEKLKEIKSWWDSDASPWVTDALEDLKSAIKSPINGIIDIAEKLANSIVKAINTVITSLNGLSFDIPDWLKYVPGLSSIAGKSFKGLNIQKLDQISIPRLATGTVVPPNREFMAVLGDNKREPEVVSPISTMKQANKEAILEVLSELGLSAGNGRNGGNETFVFQVDGNTFFEIMRNEAQIYSKRTGRPAFSI